MNSIRNRINAMGWAVVVLACALGSAATSASGAVLSSAEVLARTGKSIDAWGAAWWQWAFTHPDVQGDTTGEFGPQGNVGGPVFFAEGSSGGAVTLTYTVPTGQFILLPVATYIWTLFDPCTDSDCAADIVNRFATLTTGASATIDGVPVPGMASHLVTVDKTAPLVFQVDAGPIDSDGYGGILDAVQSGYWLMLDPLTAGAHVFDFSAFVPQIDPITGELLDGPPIELNARLLLTAVPEPDELTLLALGLVAWSIAYCFPKRQAPSQRLRLAATA